MKKLFFYVLLFAVTTLLSCSKEEIASVKSTSIESKSSNGGKSSSIRIADVNMDLSYSFYIFQSKTDVYLEANDANYNLTRDVSHYKYAYFRRDAATVQIGSVTLRQASSNSYYSFDSSFATNGNYIQIRVSGSQDVPQILDSVKSPISYSHITLPRNGSSFSDDNDLIVQWDAVSNSNMSVVIEIASYVNDSTKTNYAIYYTTDSGSYTIPAAILQERFSKGLIRINLMRGYYTINQAGNGKYYGIAAYTQHTITCKLTD